MNQIASLNVLEELGDEQLFLKRQCSTDISLSLLLLLPSMISNGRQTNEESVRIDSEGMFFNFPEMNRSILFSLYLLRVTKKVDYFLRNFVRSNSPVQYQSNSLPFIGMMLGEKITRFSSLRFCFCL